MAAVAGGDCRRRSWCGRRWQLHPVSGWFRAGDRIHHLAGRFDDGPGQRRAAGLAGRVVRSSKSTTARRARSWSGVRRGTPPAGSAKTTFQPTTKTSTSACRFARWDIACSTRLARGCGIMRVEVRIPGSGCSCTAIKGGAFDTAGATSSGNSSRRTRNRLLQSDGRRSAPADARVDCSSSTTDCPTRRSVPVSAGCGMRSSSSRRPDTR